MRSLCIIDGLRDIVLCTLRQVDGVICCLQLQKYRNVALKYSLYIYEENWHGIYLSGLATCKICQIYCPQFS